MEKDPGYIVEGNTIAINRELTELDLFIKKFIDVLKKHSDYLIVSGFVSICSGRTRATEDIDVLVPIMPKGKFKGLFDDLLKNDFWCYQGDDPYAVYSYVERFSNVRFAMKGEMFPNIEFVPIDPTKRAKWFEFTNPQKMKIGNFEFKVPPIEFEILYKEIILSGKKDIEDARHLRTFFSQTLKKENFIKFKRIIEHEAE
ncbi:hypothetical protein KY361_04055 [Candidatus Woesearchaeota archaeon]|nr:hypothetical protein [Candidatus Woesearchaeota archaeon]